MGRVSRSQVRTDAGWQAVDALNFLIAFLFVAALILLWPGQFDLGQKTEAPLADETVTEPLPTPEQTAMLNVEQTEESPAPQPRAEPEAKPEPNLAPETEAQASEVMPQQQAQEPAAVPPPEPPEQAATQEPGPDETRTASIAAASSAIDKAEPVLVEPVPQSSPSTEAQSEPNLAPEPKDEPQAQAPETVPQQQVEEPASPTAEATDPAPPQVAEPVQDPLPTPAPTPTPTTIVASDIESFSDSAPERAAEAESSAPTQVAATSSPDHADQEPIEPKPPPEPAKAIAPTAPEPSVEPPKPLVLADARSSTERRPRARPAESFDCSVLNRGINLTVSSGRSELNQKTKTRLRSIARCMRLLNGRYEIGGHTDYLGDPLGNLLLSVERAQAAANALISMGVQQRQLAIKGFGQTQPVADNFTAKGRARNRRITVVRRNG